MKRMTQEQIDRLVKDEINKKRREWYAKKSESFKINRRIRDYSHFLRQNGYEIKHVVSTANKLEDMVLAPPTAKELADRLDDCPSRIVDGDWKYDRVPADLVQDLLDHLRTEERA